MHSCYIGAMLGLFNTWLCVSSSDSHMCSHLLRCCLWSGWVSVSCWLSVKGHTMLSDLNGYSHCRISRVGMKTQMKISKWLTAERKKHCTVEKCKNSVGAKVVLWCSFKILIQVLSQLIVSKNNTSFPAQKLASGPLCFVFSSVVFKFSEPKMVSIIQTASGSFSTRKHVIAIQQQRVVGQISAFRRERAAVQSSHCCVYLN